MSKTVRFLIGPPNAGKTTCRTTLSPLSQLPCVDLGDVQRRMQDAGMGVETVEEIQESYEKALDELLSMLEHEDDVVFEHTLLKAMRRPYYIDELRQAHPGIRLECYYVCPPEDDYILRYAGEEFDESEFENEFVKKLSSAIFEQRRQRAIEIRDMFETPTTGEGFDRVVALG